MGSGRVVRTLGWFQRSVLEMRRAKKVFDTISSGWLPVAKKIRLSRMGLQGHCVAKSVPDGIGKYSKDMDKALPGKHTNILYDTLKRS